jgi:tRNA threonylcarbamoyladenosine biosynthesis protein TsaE
MILPLETDFKSTSPEETLIIGEELATVLEPGDVLCLHGDLGAGKTHLVKGISRGLGIQEQLVNSPTFTLIHEYKGRLPVYHFDLYRVKDASELKDIGAEDYLYGNGVCVIEWPDIIENDLPSNAVHVTIKKIDPTSRSISIQRSGV